MALDSRRGAAKPVSRRARPRSCVWWFLFGAILGSFGVGLYWMTQAPGQLPAPVAALPKTERPAPRQPSFQFEKILRETVVESKDTGKPPPPPAPRPEPPPPQPVTPPAATAAPPESAPGTPAEAPAQAAPKAEAKGKAEAKATKTDAKGKANAKVKADAKAKTDAKGKAEAKGKAKTEAKVKAEAKAKADARGIYILQAGSFKTAKEADAMKAKLAMRGVYARVQTVTLKDGKVWHRVTTGHLDGKQTMESTRTTLKKFGTEAVPVKIK